MGFVNLTLFAEFVNRMQAARLFFASACRGIRSPPDQGMQFMGGLILIAGATGYVGGRLRGRLEESGRPLRCLARRPQELAACVGPALEVFSVRPRGMRAAVEAAMHNEERELAESRWYDAFSSGGDARSWAGVRFGNRMMDSREGGATIRQTALFDPVGLAGLAYWYLVYPLHRLIFATMLANIARAACDEER